MNILGISSGFHDAAVTVVRAGKVRFAAHAERYSKQKNDPFLNHELIDAALEHGTPDIIVLHENSKAKKFRALLSGDFNSFNELSQEDWINEFYPQLAGIPIKSYWHHETHAAAGILTTNFQESAIMVIDAIGEFDCATIWQWKSKKLTKLHSTKFPSSLGLFYSAVTHRVGLKPNEDEYILMGMAAYGDPNRLWNDMYEMFDYVDGPDIRYKDNLHRGCKHWKPELTTEQDMFDIAAATQKTYEFTLEQILEWAKKNTKSSNLVLMGGCALNCSANHLAYKYFDDVWIMPNPGDAGSSIGAVLAHKKEHMPMDHVYLGYNIEGDYPVEEAISELKKTGIVGVANGRAEFGPRAFGNRSLLADPRGNDIKSRVNDIKQRQQFRPFAPVVLYEHAGDNFEGCYNNFMQYTSKCNHPDLYPAITHVDGTSRVQTVGPDGSGIRQLLEAWYEATGCPMLLNTSLNIKGKPIVNNLTDAQEFAIMYNIKVFTKAKND